MDLKRETAFVTGLRSLPSRGGRCLMGGTIATSSRGTMQAVCGKEVQRSPQTVVAGAATTDGWRAR